VLKVVSDETFMQTARATADYLWNGLAELGQEFPELISEVRGKGMMLGIVLQASAEDVSRLQKEMIEQGILVDVTQKTIVRLLPALTLERADVDGFLQTFRQQLSRLQKGVTA
jgi:acetylornithine aminotransferase